jgi:transcriptional regulator with XRE-family HTH domain
MQLLKEKCSDLGQAEVARRLGYSDAAVSNIIRGKYGADLGGFLARVEEIFGTTTVNCPILGEISLRKCAEIKRRPFAATNPLRVQLYRACRQCKGGKQ